MAYNSGSQATSATITDSEFRAFYSMMMTVLESGGIVKTADTGQIDWSTVNFPGANNTSAGYEIRAIGAFTIRFDFRRGAAANQSEIGLTFGTGSDGSGTITGTRLAHAAYRMIQTNGTYAISAYADANSFWLLAHRGSTNTAHLISVERTADADRNPTSHGVTLIHNDGSTGLAASRLITLTGAVPPNDVNSGSTQSGLIFPTTSFTSGLKADGNVAVYPWYFFGHGEMTYPAINIAGCFSGDFTNDAEYTVNIRGVDQTMIKIPNVFSTSISRGSTGSANILLRKG